MRTRSNVTTKDGIHCIVLIPDGIGECGLFDKAIPLIAAEGFTVTTFDMSGMSRSSDAPPETYQNVTVPDLARYVMGLLDELDIDIAAVWGCSSGGGTVLAIVAAYPERVRNGMPHEVPTYDIRNLLKIAEMEGEAVSALLAETFPKNSVGNEVAWKALGDEVHARLWKNYARWAHGYPRTIPGSVSLAHSDLTKRPLDWTVGASTPTALFFDNIVTAAKAGINISTIPGTHAPYVSDAEEFAKHVVKTAKKYI